MLERGERGDAGQTTSCVHVVASLSTTTPTAQPEVSSLLFSSSFANILRSHSTSFASEFIAASLHCHIDIPQRPIAALALDLWSAATTIKTYGSLRRRRRRRYVYLCHLTPNHKHKFHATTPWVHRTPQPQPPKPQPRRKKLPHELTLSREHHPLQRPHRQLSPRPAHPPLQRRLPRRARLARTRRRHRAVPDAVQFVREFGWEVCGPAGAGDAVQWRCV